jgi:hypothetical protein
LRQVTQAFRAFVIRKNLTQKIVLFKGKMMTSSFQGLIPDAQVEVVWWVTWTVELFAGVDTDR